MYKFMVVTDPETAPGFRLAGVDVVEAADVEEARTIIPDLLYRDDTGIVAINEEFLAGLDAKVLQKMERTHRPIILPIPSGKKAGEGASYVERLLQRAIGYNIVVRR
ncbi:MAG TPA: V-type ATP synthase subunit F [Methanomicrobiales archaeon]|jgi:V/A-type H+-transporting ATPase subunit F|nr:V-type ATP synthase subunit F [Methanomicrobiales archaeon]